MNTFSGEKPRTGGRALRVAHLTTVDMSLALLLGTELQVDRSAGHEVIGISAPGRYVREIEALGVGHVPIKNLTRPWDPVRDLVAFGELVLALRRLRPDVLHTHNPKTGVLGRIAGRIAGVPVVVNTCHGLWARPGDALAKRAFVYGLESLAARFSDFELFQNAQDAATLRPALKKDRHRVVGNGIDLDRFVPRPDGRSRVRAELGVGDHELLVGTVGRRVREKGLAEFCGMAEQLADRARFVWVGPVDDVERDASFPGMNAVQFLDERTDMPDVYSALDIFVLASHREGFSRASMEAAACGAPMVLSDIRGCREIGTDRVHLLRTAPQNAKMLAETVRMLLDDAGLRRRLGDTARARALTEFDQCKVARASLAAYDYVAEERQLQTHRRTDSRTTVLHVLPSDLDRGAQVFAGKLRDALADDPEQHHLTVALFEGPAGSLRPDIRLGIRAGHLRRVGFDPRAARALRQTIRTSGVALLVAHGGESLKYVVAAAGHTPVIYYKVGLSAAEVGRSSRARIYRILAARTARVAGVSQAILDQAHDLLRVDHTKLALAANGRDPQIYHPAADGAQAAKRPVILFLGQLEHGKRPDLFLDVIAALREAGRRFDAWMVGDGPLREQLRKRAATLGVELMGVRSDVPDLLRRASVLVMTSEFDTEGMPGVLIEAGLSGVPVVTTAAAGAKDIVVDGETGFVLHSDRPHDLAAAITTLLADSALRKKLGEQGRRRCVSWFSIEAATDLWRALISELAGTSKPHLVDQFWNPPRELKSAVRTVAS